MQFKIVAPLRMIVFVDPFNSGLSHVPVNVGVIETALLASPNDNLIIAAEPAHADGLLQLLDPRFHSRISARIALTLPAPGSRFMSRLRGDLSSLSKVFAASSGNATLILADLAPATLHALRLRTLLRPDAFRLVVAILHGNAVEISGWRARNPLVRVTQLRTSMRLAPGNTCFAVLEPSIREALRTCAPELAGRIAALPHPLPLRELLRSSRDPAESAEIELRRPVRIAFLGAAQEKKGFGTYLDLARELRHRLPGAVTFHAIGWMPPESVKLDLSCLDTPPGRNKISREDFVRALSEVDYVCMPYDKDLYRYSASGTLVDAVAWGKPILAIRSPTLDDLVREFGDIGELADSASELADRIEALIRGRDIDRYRRQVAGVLGIAASRAPDRLASTFQRMRVGG